MDIFPDLVWQNILDRLESGDIQAVFSSYPNIIQEPRLQRRKGFWLFEDAILILSTWKNLLGITDLLNCRLVCRRWSSAVDKIFAEDLHPDYFRDPLKSQNICYWEDNDRFNSIWKLPNMYIETQSFATDNIIRFMDAMENNNGDRNPFISRSASFSLILSHPYLDANAGGLENDEENRLQFQMFEKQLICLLSKFGEHIFYFKLSLEIYSHSELEVLEQITEFLCLLPNLKCLTIEGKIFVEGNPSENADHNLPGDIHFPPLPFLEKVRLNVYKESDGDFYDYYRNYNNCKSVIHHILTSAYSQPVESQSIALTNKGNYPIYLHLKELEVTHEVGYYEDFYFYNLLDRGNDFWVYSWVSEYGISDFLPHHAPTLTSLKFEARPQHTDTIEYAIIEKLLTKLPHLRYLEIGDEHHHLRESGDISRINGHVKSLKYLKIEDNVGLRYDFLLSFSFLRHLILYRSYILNEDECKKSDAVAVGIVKIRRQIYNGFLYRSNVWRLLPKLKRVSLIDLDRVRSFTRDVWELKVKPKKKRTQQEIDLLKWNMMINSDGNQCEEGVGSILDDKMSVSVKNRWELLDEE